ncbi:MAG: hypothetical protein IJN45_05945 [Alistipes sp.]|nr:hypothetical protein [Alistipes sp.]
MKYLEEIKLQSIGILQDIVPSDYVFNIIPKSNIDGICECKYKCIYVNKNNVNDCIIRLEFSIDENREYMYHLEKFCYQENMNVDTITNILSNFMLNFCDYIRQIDGVVPNDTKYFSIRYQEGKSYKLKECMPLLDYDGEYAYFIK